MDKCCQNCRYYEADYPYKICHRFRRAFHNSIADSCAEYEELTEENKVNWHENYYDKETGEIKEFPF